MNFKTLLGMGAVGIALHGCTSFKGFHSEDDMSQFASPQQLIIQKNINHSNGAAKPYVYSWGKQKNEYEVQSLYPRKYLSQYCSAQGGKFTLLHKSAMTLVTDRADKKRLMASAHVKQGIGAYRCIQANKKQWIASIEPVSESALEQDKTARVVLLQTQLLSAEQAKKLYNPVQPAPISTKKANSNDQKNKAVTNKVATQKEPDPQLEVKKEDETEATFKTPFEPTVKEALQILETPQQQQLKAYVAARRDLNKGKNQVNACNNAQLAYNHGKLKATNGSVYKDSGMLVARCLTNVPIYSSRFSNPKAQAVKILQNLANNHNHAGAKHMLKQIK